MQMIDDDAYGSSGMMFRDKYYAAIKLVTLIRSSH
jgi:hypothetical protein